MAISAKTNPKLLFSYIRKKQHGRDNIRLLRTESNDEIVDSSQIAEMLNGYFQSVFVKESENETMPDFACRTNIKCNDDVNVLFLYDDLKDRLKKLKHDKSMGEDRVSPVLLKHCADAFVVPLLIIFRKSFDEGITPSE